MGKAGATADCQGALKGGKAGGKAKSRRKHQEKLSSNTGY